MQGRLRCTHWTTRRTFSYGYVPKCQGTPAPKVLKSIDVRSRKEVIRCCYYLPTVPTSPVVHNDEMRGSTLNLYPSWLPILIFSFFSFFSSSHHSHHSHVDSSNSRRQINKLKTPLYYYWLDPAATKAQ